MKIVSVKNYEGIQYQYWYVLKINIFEWKPYLLNLFSWSQCLKVHLWLAKVFVYPLI